MNNKIPLCLALENAKGELFRSLNKILSETGLPAYLCEGILEELLAEVRKQKCFEIINEINAAKAAKTESEDENQ